MGKKITIQKNTFCGRENVPKTNKNVIHVVDIAYMLAHEKAIVKKYSLRGQAVRMK